MENKICEQCNKEFQYELKPGYPRKYCLECSAKRKAEFEGTTQAPTQTPTQGAGLMSQKDIMIISQCLTKAWAECPEKEPKEILDAYRFFVSELEQNG